jgi:hypothetical protein
MTKKTENNVLSTEKLQELGNLIALTVKNDASNSLAKLQNYYNIYLDLEYETDKNVYEQNVAFVCEIGKISTDTWKKKRSNFNSAFNYKIDVLKLKSENELRKLISEVVKGTKRVLKNGKVKTDVANSAKIEAEKVEIQAVNENEIIELLANPDFKKAMDFVEKNGVLKATFMKAWAKYQAK